MPLIRVTWFFEQQGYGWTESLWLDGASTDLDSYNGVSDVLAAKRIILSGAQTFLRYSRISEEGIFRDAAGRTYPGPGLQGKTTQESDEPATALLMNCRNLAGTKRRQFFLRGVWDAVVVEGGGYTPTPAFQGYLNAYVAQLAADHWGWQGANTRTIGLVTQVTQMPSGTVEVQLGSDVFIGPFPVAKTVRIAGVLGATQINGAQLVLASTARKFETRRRISMFPWTTGGKVTLTTKAFVEIFTATPRRVVNRKPGRPSYKSVGRRSARAAS